MGREAEFGEDEAENSSWIGIFDRVFDELEKKKIQLTIKKSRRV